ncbi:hypothetical protein ACFXJ6_35990 [Streptomyces sp. NPDC059218]|uniref:hypothetical protein n=1 Tax=unclassified Streptomyces TaxID=2593676 RepID=UPI00367DC09B
MTFRCPAALTAPLLLLALLTGCGRDTGPVASPEPRAARPAPAAGPATTPPTSWAPPTSSTSLTSSTPPAAPPPAPASPHPATTAPEPGTPSPVRPTARTTPAAPAPARTPAPVARTGGGGGGGGGRAAGTTLRIGAWSSGVVRGGQETIDACRDAVQWAGPDFGQEDGYKMRTVVVVGHDYCGFGQFATLPIGTEVTVETPRQTLRYRVYARHLTPGRGTPAHGLYWGDLTLQSCLGPDTGFSYLVRV